jgi:hypothetical protein
MSTVYAVYISFMNQPYGEDESHQHLHGLFSDKGSAWRCAMDNEYKDNTALVKMLDFRPTLQVKGDPVRYKEMYDRVFAGAVVDDAFLAEWEAVRVLTEEPGSYTYGIMTRVVEIEVHHSYNPK